MKDELLEPIRYYHCEKCNETLSYFDCFDLKYPNYNLILCKDCAEELNKIIVSTLEEFLCNN